MEMTLLLNATYEPLRVVHWQKAITLLWQGKVEVLEVYDKEIHGISITIKLPPGEGRYAADQETHQAQMDANHHDHDRD